VDTITETELKKTETRLIEIILRSPYCEMWRALCGATQVRSNTPASEFTIFYKKLKPCRRILFWSAPDGRAIRIWSAPAKVPIYRDDDGALDQNSNRTAINMLLRLVLVGVISWIFPSTQPKNDPRNHTNQHEQNTEGNRVSNYAFLSPATQPFSK
jgi:hypothetical protein